MTRSTDPDRLEAIVEEWPSGVAIGVAIATAVAVAVADYVTGRDIQLFFFYLIPIAISTWHFGFKAGMAFALAEAAITVTIALRTPGGVSTNVAFFNGFARLASFVVITWLISRQRTLVHIRTEQAITDPLTGAMNRRGFEARCRTLIADSHGNRAPTSVVFFDVDGLKDLNDAEGHDAGDELLIRLADTVRKTIRRGDAFARLGGDEFALLLPGTTNSAAAEFARRISAALVGSNGERSIQVSMGVATSPESTESADHLLDRADKLMYLAKSTKSGLVVGERES